MGEHRYLKVNNAFYRGRTESCYGKDHWTVFGERPVLCAGTVIGNREGITRFLSVLVNEFHTNNLKENADCKSPVATDQWTMNYLFYTDRFSLDYRQALYQLEAHPTPFAEGHVAV